MAPECSIPRVLTLDRLMRPMALTSIVAETGVR